MSPGRVSLVLIMKVTALVAADLALFGREVWILGTPYFFFLIAAINVVAVRGLILAQPLRGADYIFLIVGVFTSVAATAILYGSGLPAIVWGLVQRYQKYPSVRRIFESLFSLLAPELWLGLVVGIIGLALAWGAGRLVSRRELRRRQRPGRRIWRAAGTRAQGAIIGLGLFTIALIILAEAGLPPPHPLSPRWPAFLFALAASPVVGALVISFAPRSGPGEAAAVASETPNKDQSTTTLQVREATGVDATRESTNPG
jgi:hypothetical protein